MSVDEARAQMGLQEKDIKRRDFLRISGAGIAAISSLSFWPQRQGGAGFPERAAPRDPVVLKSPRLELILDRTDGVPYAYRLLPSGTMCWGENLGEPPSATVCQKESWKFSKEAMKAARVKTLPHSARFEFPLEREGKPAAQCTVAYRLEDATVYVALEDVQEAPGFELIEVGLPQLVTVREEDGTAWLAHGENGGSFATLGKAANGRLPPNRFWGQVLASLPIVMVGSEKVLCVQETTAFMDDTLLALAGDAGRRRASLGTVQRHRVNGSLCYDMNTGPGTPLVCGNRDTPNLLIGQKPSCRLDFVLPSPGKTDVHWLDGARIVRERMPKMPTRYYDGKFVYAIRCDEPGFKQPSATFAQCEQLIRDVAALTDKGPQVVHLWGWQYGGKDTGYPAVAEVNPRIGGVEGLRHLLAEGPKHGCRVTFSDNYDDAYRSSPAWDPAMIARRPDGELWLSRNWTGEDSYVLGLAKYMAGPGRERVRFTCEHYDLKETIHVDVLSYFTIRNDWDHHHPASGVKNLFEGRYKIIEEFKKYGVDVSSEAMRYAAIGKISLFWYMASPKPCPFGGTPIPLQPMIYRKSAYWGQGGGKGSLADRIMNTLFYNGCIRAIFRGDTDRQEITDLYYLDLLPWSKVKDRNIESFLRDDQRTVIYLEGDSCIEQDWGTNRYSVTVDGVGIARDLATFCPLDANRIVFYALEERELSTPLPSGWKKEEIVAMELSTGDKVRRDINWSGERIHVTVQVQCPVIVYRSEAAMVDKTQKV